MKLKLAHKIIINFTIILIIPMLLSLVLVTGDLSERSQNEINNHLDFTSRIVNKFFFRTINSLQIKLNVLALSKNFRSAMEKGDIKTAESVMESWRETINFSFADVYSLYNFSGRESFEVVLSVHNGNFPDALKTPYDALRSASRGKVTSTMIFPDEKRSYFRHVMQLPTSGGMTANYVLAVLVPLPNESIDSIKEITDIDIVIYNREKAVLSTLFDATGRRAASMPLADNARAALEKRETFRVEEKFLNTDVFAVYSKIIDGDKALAGYICAIIPRELAAKSNMFVVNYLYMIMIISLILALASGYLLSRDIVRPLKIFTKLAGIISDGNFGQRIDISRGDEIGDLASEFNKMRGKLEDYDKSLKRRMFEVSTLYEVSRSMNFLNNKEQLLTIILTKTIDALNSEKGSIMLYNAEECMLACEMAVGYPGMFQKRVKFAPGQGKAGEAFSKGEAIISNDIQRDSSFVRTEETKNSDSVTRNLMCIPMKSKDEVIGVINVVNKKGGEDFNEYDRALAMSLATQAAMTIDNARLYELSITDGMTKLFIHRYFQIRLEEEMKRSVRYGKPVSLVMTDIDHFKKFNDTYGHQIGDMVLIKVADIMRETIRNEIDIACRYGGEEFAVIAPQTGPDDARRMAERLRDAIERAALAGPNGKTLKITISLGVSTYPNDTQEKKDLIMKSDAALYYSKEHGRNRLTHFADIPPEEQGDIGHKQQ
ncbi:MAG TPA: diguanylate cyclase [Candidatus Wallbacteria bacterium]|nr:diguanylate cyclase [Candidatus Wallbacteria bacterium]